MHKTLKFYPELVPLILSGEKTATWRFWDDKDLQVNDEIELYDLGEKKVFAKARVTEVVEKPMKELTEEDMKGHEEFNNYTQMYETYSGYYGKPVTPDTIVKIVRFELL